MQAAAREPEQDDLCCFYSAIWQCLPCCQQRLSTNRSQTNEAQVFEVMDGILYNYIYNHGIMRDMITDDIHKLNDGSNENNQSKSLIWAI
eukprot:scaffold154772_cov42-Prasinocladus_malaysianus.AAC.1